MRAGQHRLDHFRTALADQVAQLRDQFVAHRIFAKESARHGNHQQQHRGQREDHVKRQRGTLAGGAVAGPLPGGVHQQPADLGRTQDTQQGLGKAHGAKLGLGEPLL
ncbi:hypothetical protein D3C72_1541890 [compost metagenome]